MMILVLTICLVFVYNATAYAKEKGFKPGFSLKVSYGTRYHYWGDMNKHLESYNQSSLYKLTRMFFPELITGETRALKNFSPDWEVELRADIGRSFALSLATSSSVHQKNENSITCKERSYMGERETFAYLKPQAEVSMPIRLGINYTLPFIPRLNIIFNLGIGYYSARISEYRYEKVTTFYPGFAYESIYWETRYWETEPKGAIGVHSGIGVEFSPHKNFAFVVEIQGRYLKINNLKGSIQTENETALKTAKGTLYYYGYSIVHAWFWGKNYKDLTIWQEPTYGSGDIRKAVLDLSGFSLRAGIRIRLF